jgi:hypothetical protein
MSSGISYVSLRSMKTRYLSSLDLATGEPVLGPVRLGSVADVYASPVAAAGRVYVVGRDGATEVLSHGSKYEVLAVNELTDTPFDATPALVDRELFLRGATHLYCIVEDEAATGG